MKMSEFKGLAVADLHKKAQQMSKDLFEMKMKHSMGQLTNPVQIREARKNLARVHSAISMASKGNRG